jgi:amino acid adenylation domain-containing protein
MQMNVLKYLERTLDRFRDKTAVRSQELDLTFGEIEKYSKKLGWEIHQRLTNTKLPVAVFLPKTAYSVVAYIGILYSGNAYVPLDVHSPIGRIESILDNLEQPLVITSRQYYGMLTKSVNPDRILVIEEAIGGELEYQNNALLSIAGSVIDTDPAYIIYTSGSSGQPKGVVVSHRSIIDYIDWAVVCFEITHDEVIGNQSPFYFDNSTLDLYLTLATGACLVIIPEQYFSFPTKLLEYVESCGISFIFWVPSVMIHAANVKALDYITVRCLKKILFAGEVMPNKHLNYWRDRIKDALYANLYGPTEITVDCTYYVVNRSFSDTESLPIGYPCRNTDVLLLNDKDQAAARGEIGELCVRGSSLALGYWNDFSKSDKVFTQNPLNQHYFDRIYRTGDLAYKNDFDELIFIGRKDNQIKHMGYRIELGEIENAVLSLDGIHNGCVLYNREKSEITLIYEGEEIEREIRRKLITQIPKYMIPTKYYRLNQLPLNSNGKIDRRTLTDFMMHEDETKL